MTGEPADAALSRRAFVLTALLIVFVFLFLRLWLFVARTPFFDELFTLWIAKKPLAGIWNALQFDSGPPLYYVLVHALFAIVRPSLALARGVSLVASSLAIGTILFAPFARRIRLAAALFFAIFPAAVYFASEARAYALAGALAGVAVLFLDRWSESGSRRDLAIATIAFVACAWTHDYGVLLFPLPLLFAISSRSRRWRDAIVATFAEAVSFTPGFLLAMHQPSEATLWIGNQLSLDAPMRFSFAANYPEVFSPSPGLLVRIVSFVAVFLVVAFGTRSLRAFRWSIATLLPLLLAIAFAVAGRPIYFPLRFEAFVAFPFAIWLALAWSEIPRLGRIASLAVLSSTAAVALTLMISYQIRQGDDPYRAAARVAVAAAGSHEAIVASGSAYLEVLDRHPGVIAFPAVQALHPGWRAIADRAALEREAGSLERRGARFVWVGDVVAPEYHVLATHFTFAPIARFGPVGVARAMPRE